MLIVLYSGSAENRLCYIAGARKLIVLCTNRSVQWSNRTDCTVEYSGVIVLIDMYRGLIVLYIVRIVLSSGVIILNDLYKGLIVLYSGVLVSID